MTGIRRVACAAALLLAACGRGGDDDAVIRLNGRIEAVTVDLGPRVPGRVTEVLVREGDRVKAGDVLVRVDLGETGIAVEREQAAMRAAEARAEDMRSGSRCSASAMRSSSASLRSSPRTTASASAGRPASSSQSAYAAFR